MKTKRARVGYRTITPEVARVLLKRSKRVNVPTSKRKIDQYARAMLAGTWDEYNSQAVSIDWNGDIVNGHQRLTACVKAGVPFRTLYVEGVPPESFKTEDTGRGREAGHFFAVLGESCYMELAAAARGLYMWERGQWRRAVVAAGRTGDPITNDELKGEVDRRPELRDAAKYLAGHKDAMRGRFKCGILGALWVLTRPHDRHAGFWSELLDRLSTDKTSPPYQLNRRIDQVKSRGAHLSGPTLLALLTKAWNHYAIGGKTSLLWDPGKERMPDPMTTLTPALLPPDPTPPDVIVTTSPPKRGATAAPPPAGPPAGRPDPPAGRKRRRLKLRGGLNGTPAG